jgi:hypothetical protein
MIYECMEYTPQLHIQGVSEIHVLILTSGRTRQFMNILFIIFCKIRKSFLRFFAPQFLPNFFCVINCLFFGNHENFNFNCLCTFLTRLRFSLTR